MSHRRTDNVLGGRRCVYVAKIRKRKGMWLFIIFVSVLKTFGEGCRFFFIKKTCIMNLLCELCYAIQSLAR